LTVHPDSVRALYLGARSSRRRRELADLARRQRVPVHDADEPTLRKRARSDSHQGVVALVTAFEYVELEAAIAGGRPVLAVDQMNDPQNLGALVRTATAAGFAALILPERGSAGVTAAVEKASAGAVNDIGICRVVNLVRALEKLADAGYWRLALTPHDAPSLFDAEIPTPVALVLGGETGIRRLVLERCDLVVRIPQFGPVESLNASVAGAVAMYEVARRESRPQ
jgi:23S rRNA (guanosine2251-2'-O)-methyltransferase